MSKTPVVGSVDAKVRVASHLSKVPLTATDAFTANLIELPSVVILKTGTCARLTDGNTADAKRMWIANRMLRRVCLSNIPFLPPVAMRADGATLYVPCRPENWHNCQSARGIYGSFRITEEHSWRWARGGLRNQMG